MQQSPDNELRRQFGLAFALVAFLPDSRIDAATETLRRIEQHVERLKRERDEYKARCEA